MTKPPVIGYIAMTMHDNEGTWADEHEPYPVYASKAIAQREADKLASARDRTIGVVAQVQMPYTGTRPPWLYA